MKNLKSFLGDKSSCALAAATGQVFGVWWNYIYFFTDEKFLLWLALLRTHKMIWYTAKQPYSAASMPAVFRSCIPLKPKSVRSLSQYQNSVISISFSLNLALKSSGSIIEKCYRCKNCCQWSAALLEIVFVFQQDNAPTYLAHDMIELLCNETPPHSLIVICGQPTLLT